MAEELSPNEFNAIALKCECRKRKIEETGSGERNSDSLPRCCLKQRFGSMLRNKCFSDVCFIVGEERQRITAHKAVLSTSSSVFEAMFNKNWSADSKEIDVPDIEPEAFYSLISFLYTNEVELTADSALEILYAAEKYAVHLLEDQCCAFLEGILSPENACSLLMQARKFDQPKLIKACYGVIDVSPEDALMSDSFVRIDSTVLRSILERDTLTIAEVDLFDAVVRWSIAECQRQNLDVNENNQKSVLEGAVSLVRFPLMCQKEFASLVLPSNLLSKDEALDMFRYFSDIPSPSLSFNSTPRSSKIPLFVGRFRTSQSPSSAESRTYVDGIGISFDHGVRILGFLLFTSRTVIDAQCSIDITVKNQKTGAILYQSSSNSITYTLNRNEKEVSGVHLKKSIKLAANTQYAAIIKMQGPETVTGDDGKSNVEYIDSNTGKKLTISFKTIDFEGSSGRTDKNRGQIPGIYFTW